MASVQIGAGEAGDVAAADAPIMRGGAINLAALADAVREKPLVVIGCLVAGFLLAIVYLHVATKKYSVRLEVIAASSPSQETGGGLRAITALAGLDLGGESNSQFRLFLAALRSPVAADAIAGDQELLKLIFPKDWSVSESRWREPPSIIRPIARPIAAFFGFTIPSWAPPGKSRVYEYLNNELKVVQDVKSGVVTLEIDTDRTQVAERFLITLNNMIDELMRKRDLEHTSGYIGYLTNRLASVSVEDYRKALVLNLTQQEKNRMLSSSPLPYVSEILGKPMISSKPVSPAPLAALLGGVILGGVAGVLWAGIAYQRRRA